MTIDLQKAREMFLHAVGKLPMESWGQYVAQECGGDDDLRQHVELLLQVHRDAGSFLDTPAVAIGETMPDHQPRPELAGTVIGPFKLIEKIGEGGMGIVYAAEQTSLSRRVALKILPSASLWSANALERFRKEVRITATLEHPNIVPIYEMGYDRNVHFYAMKLVEGCSLAEVITHRKQEIATQASDANDAPPSAETVVAAITQTVVGKETWYRAVAKLGMVAASTLSFAHKRGVIHRDIKPSNLLLDREGKLFIADFGLARLEADVNMTRTGDLMGTPRFMSPEQALGKSSKELDARSDIFSLGSTLYELLTLKPVIIATAPASAIRELKTLQPIPLRTHDPNIPHPLERIVLKCLETDPIDRYSGADELAKDLDRYIEGLTVVARPPGPVRRTSRWIQRHPKTTLSVIAGLFLSLIVLATGFWVVQRQSGESWLRGPPSEDLVDSSTTPNLPSDLKSPEESPDMLRSNRNNRNNENRRNDNSPSRSLQIEKLEGRALMAGLTIGTPLSLGSGVNSVDYEQGPTTTADGLSLLFQRYSAPNSPTEILEATRSSTSLPFGNVVSAGAAVNDPGGFPNHPEVSRDGLTMLFSKDDKSGMYQATRSSRSAAFGSVTSLGDLLPGQPAHQPSLTADGLTLFFTAWDTAGIQNDIYQATRSSVSDPWGNVVMLSSAINMTGYNDAMPGISSDGLLLFFNSNRPGGFGAFDLYYATRPSQQSPWEPAINLGSKVNTASDDKGPNISPDGSLLYFHSNRPGGAGAEDLYQAAIIYVDSTKFYVVNDGNPDRTYEYSAAGGVIENYTINNGNTAPRGAAGTAAGDKVWVVDAIKRVYVYDSNGGLAGNWNVGSLSPTAQVEGIATNGNDVWLVDNKTDKIFKYAGAASRLSGSQNAVSSFSLNSGNTSPKDLVTDGTSIWVVNDSSTDKVFKYSLTGSLIGSWTISTPGVSSPTGITLNPASPSELWIVDNGTDRVYQYDAAVGVTSGSLSASSSFALAAGNTNPQGIADPPPPSDSVRMQNAVMASPTASGLVAPMANSKANDMAFSQLSDDFVRGCASSTFEMDRTSRQQSLVAPQSSNSRDQFESQQFMQPARSENRASSQAKRLVGTTDDIFSNWSLDELKDFEMVS